MHYPCAIWQHGGICGGRSNDDDITYKATWRRIWTAIRGIRFRYRRAKRINEDTVTD